MRGFSLIEVLVVLAIVSIPVFFLVRPGRTWKRDAVLTKLRAAKVTSLIGREKIPVLCSGDKLILKSELKLKGCRVSCKKIVFHPSGYVAPTGHIDLLCEGKGWRFIISLLGRIRILELGTKKAMRN